MYRSSSPKFFSVLSFLLIGVFGVSGLFTLPPTDDPGISQKIDAADRLTDESAADDLSLVSTNEQSIVLEFSPPEYQLKEETAENQECQSVEIEGYAETDQPGWPRLPVKGAMLGIPPSAAPAVTILSAEFVDISGAFDLCPVKSPILEHNLDQVNFTDWEVQRDQQAYAQDQFFPEKPAVLDSTAFIRSQQVAQLAFYPFQYNPARKTLRYYQRIRIRLDFEDGQGAVQGAGTEETTMDEGPFEKVLEASLLNYQQARSWRVRPETSTVASPAHPQNPPGQPAYKISVDRDGIYQVSYADLAEAELPVDTIDPRTFQIFNQGEQIALHILGEQDGTFDPGDYLLFYGEKVNTRYTDVNVYWLYWGEASGLRMGSLDGSPGGGNVSESFWNTYHLEGNLLYLSNFTSGEQDDHWYWGNYLLYSTGAPVTQEIPFNISHIAAPSADIVVRGALLSNYAVPHTHVKIYLNDHLIDDAYWPSQTEYFFAVMVPAGYLLEGSNILKLEAPMDGGIQRLIVPPNWFEIEYASQYTADNNLLYFNAEGGTVDEYQVNGYSNAEIVGFDITDPRNPLRIENAVVQPQAGSYTYKFKHAITDQHHYVVLASSAWFQPLSILADEPSALREAANGADYILITHADFYSATLPLANWRASQGLRVQVVDVQDIYDEFNGGVFDSRAIRDFLAYAYTNWQPPAPLYILLVGDGTYDFKNYVGTNTPTFMPPYLAWVDPWLGERPADNRFVTIAGQDILPDMFIGRLAVRDAVQITAAIANIIGYEQNPPADNWNSRVLFIADNADKAGDFAAYSDQVADFYLPEEYTAQKIYYGITHPTVSGVKTGIIDAVNQGSLLVNFVGHATYNIWAGENFYSASALPSLNNAGRLPFHVAMACMDGSFDLLPGPALAESMTIAAGKGAIGSFSSTGWSVASGHDYLHEGLYLALFEDGIIGVGAATTQAKFYLYANTAGHRDLIDTFMLFGDPALKLNVLPADLQINQSAASTDPLHPGDSVQYTLDYANTGSASATHVVITDLLPAGLIDPLVTSSGAQITPRPGQSFVWDVETLSPGEGGSIQILATVASDFSGLLINQASITTAIIETDYDNNISEIVQIPVISPDLWLQKQGPAAARIGDLVTYRLAYTNQGDDLAAGVVITDSLPADLLDPIVTSSGAQITPRSGAHFVWDVEDLSPGEGGAITITGELGTTAASSLSNSAHISAASLEANRTNNHAGPVYTQVLSADLALGKSGPPVAVPGASIQYTLDFMNAGTDLAVGVVLTDIIPVEVINPIITSSGAQITLRPGSRFVWDVENLSPGEGGTILINGQVAVNASGLFTNEAKIATASFESVLANNQAGPVTTVVAMPDLEIDKTAPAVVSSGGLITYVLSYANTGSALAQGVVLTDVIPAEVANPAVTSSGAAITPRPGSAYIWDIENLSPGESGMITITGTVTPGFTGVLSNQASISTASVEVHTANNQAGPVLTGVNAPELSIEKHAPVAVFSGSPIEYVLSYMNSGAALASGVVITDLLPAEIVTPVLTASGATVTPRPGQAFVWDVADLLPGSGGVITITGTVSPTFTGVLSNQADIFTPDLEANTGNNHAGPILTGVNLAEVFIEKQAPASITSGGSIQYILSFANLGVLTATNVVITDSLPLEVLDPIVVSGGVSITLRSGSAFVWDAADLAPGDSGMITITGTVQPGFGGLLANQASITTASPEVTLENNLSSVQTLVGIPDLLVTKQGPSALLSGETIHYTLNYLNIGTGLAAGVVLTDALPVEILDPQVASDGAAITPRPGQPYTWDIADLSPWQSGVITITGRVQPGFSGLFSNQASLSTTSLEVALSNNLSGPIYTTVRAPDLVIGKQGPGEALSGETIQYVLNATNLGNASANSVVITDSLPPELGSVLITFSGAAITPRPGTAYVWDVEDLAPGAGAAITITGIVQPGFVGQIFNQAAVGGASVESSLGNNYSQGVATTVRAPDLSILKRGPQAALSGETIQYVLEFANLGSAVAAGVVISDVLSAELLDPVVVSSGAALTVRPGEAYVWDAADLLPGESGRITITAQVRPGFAGALTNRASIGAGQAETSQANNSTVVLTSVRAANLSIQKTAPAAALFGDQVTYRLSYANLGSAPAAQVVIEDLLPAPLLNPLITFSGAQLTSQPGKMFAWDIDVLTPGQGGVITITGWIEPGYSGLLTNTASISTVDIDSSLDNNQATAATQVERGEFMLYMPFVPLLP